MPRMPSSSLLPWESSIRLLSSPSQARSSLLLDLLLLLSLPVTLFCDDRTYSVKCSTQKYFHLYQAPGRSSTAADSLLTYSAFCTDKHQFWPLISS
ncbi:hypothetical protein B0H11DRAFT_753991 [Mycena galericulata]|nr:hypothetical protein B0H11DRAFT_753991 [Mycena galericulata]